MRRLSLVTVFAVLVLAAAGCATAPPQARVARDESVDFRRYSTFMVQSPPAAAGYTTVGDRLLDQRVRAAIASALVKHGYREVMESADLRVAYDVAKREKSRSSPIRIGVGVGGMSGNLGGGVSVGTSPVARYLEGTLAIDAVDTARNAQVWQGSLTGKLKDQSLEEASIRRVVGTILEDFPARLP